MPESVSGGTSFLSRLGSSRSTLSKEYRATVQLLDDAETLSIEFKKGDTGAAVFASVCDALNIAERDYFGLRYMDTYKNRVRSLISLPGLFGKEEASFFGLSLGVASVAGRVHFRGQLGSQASRGTFGSSNGAVNKRDCETREGGGIVWGSWEGHPLADGQAGNWTPEALCWAWMGAGLGRTVGGIWGREGLDRAKKTRPPLRMAAHGPNYPAYG